MHRLLNGYDIPELKPVDTTSKCSRAGVHLCTPWGETVRKLRNTMYALMKQVFHKDNYEARKLFVGRKIFVRFVYEATDDEQEEAFIQHNLETPTYFQICRVQLGGNGGYDLMFSEAFPILDAAGRASACADEDEVALKATQPDFA